MFEQNRQDPPAKEQKFLNNGKYHVINANYHGQGTYGGVYRVHDEDGQIFAVKEIKETIGSQGIYGNVIRQKAILKELSHNNIIRLTEDFFENNKAFLVFPYFEMNLRELMRIQYNNQVPPLMIKKIMSQLLSALKEAHNARIIHRDVKPQNIMVEQSNEEPNNFTLKLADWGSSRKINTGNNQLLTVQVIPIAYRPPQLFFQTKRYSQTVDIWSVGCIFYQLLMGQRPFLANLANQIIFEMMNKVGLSETDDQKWMLDMYRKIGFQICEEDIIGLRGITFDLPFQTKFGHIPPACDLIKKMLRIHPEKRLSASDCLKHPYFDTKIQNSIL